MGMGSSDLSLALRVSELAEQRGVGRRIDAPIRTPLRWGKGRP
jgi:hypothetical protein